MRINAKMQFSNNKTEQQQENSMREGILEGGTNAASNDFSSAAAAEHLNAHEVEYEKVLERIGFGNAQWIQLLISGLLTITSMATQTSVGIMAIAMQCEFDMKQTAKGIMMAACVTGVVLSTYLWGYVSDSVGRRTVLLYGTFVTNLLQFISMFITNIWFFNIVNLIMGISLGGISAALYAYLSEFNMARHRAVVINYSTMFVSIVGIYVPATAWWILSADWSVNIYDGFVFRPWRLIILANLLPGLIGGLMLLPFPESPKLLLAQNKEHEALLALTWICKLNTGRSVASILETDDFKLKPEHLDDDEELFNNRNGLCGILQNIWSATLPLVHKPHRTNFLISAAAVFGLFFSSSGMQIWFPEIVNRSSGGSSGNNTSLTVCEILDASFASEAHNETSDANAACDDSITTKTYVDNMIVGAAFLVGFIIQGMLLNPIGRKNVLVAALVIATCSGICLHFITNPIILLILFCLYILMPGLSISIMCGAVVDLVPTKLRGKAVSICLTLGRFGVIIAANIFAVMLQPYCSGTFALFTISMCACAVLVHFLPI